MHGRPFWLVDLGGCRLVCANALTLDAWKEREMAVVA